MKILGLGNALVDVLVQLTDDSLLKKLGLPKGSMQLIDSGQVPVIEKAIENSHLKYQSGGSAANTIYGLASLGSRCGYIGKIGKDSMGNIFRADMNKVKVSHLLYESENPTGRAFTFISDDGERTFATFLGAAVELNADDLYADLFKSYDLLHIEGYLVQNTELVERALKLAKESGLMVSLDLASYNVVENNRDFLSRMIPEFIDIVFANEEEARAFTGKSPEVAVNEIAGQCNIAVVKTGKNGSLVKAEQESIQIGTIPAKVLDTTGAGDQYAAGFLFGLSENCNLWKCGNLGALMAGKVIQTIGARIQDEELSSIRIEVKKLLHE